MTPKCRTIAAFTLLELLIVLAVLGVLVGVVLPRAEPNLHEQLRGTARILAAELTYARSLAVANNSQYRVTFDVANQRLVLEHSGTNATLNRLPNTAFHLASDPPLQHFVDLDELPSLGLPVRIVGAVRGKSSFQSAADVEFGPLGGTTTSSPTTLWLSAASGDRLRYITLSIDPVTGLVNVGSMTASGLPAVLQTQNN